MDGEHHPGSRRSLCPLRNVRQRKAAHEAAITAFDTVILLALFLLLERRSPRMSACRSTDTLTSPFLTSGSSARGIPVVLDDVHQRRPFRGGDGFLLIVSAASAGGQSSRKAVLQASFP